ncbi:MAG: hypothetical protein AB1762_08920 [Gemmatimonadota bacterium]
MNTQTAVIVAILSAPIVTVSRSAHAQAVKPTYREISAIGTASEMTLVRAVSDRLRTRFTGDAAFAKQIYDALRQRRESDAVKLIAQVVQVDGAEIVIAEAKATSSGRSANQAMARLASTDADVIWSTARYNPWWVIIETEKYIICAGFGCKAEMRRRGLIP